MCGLTGCWYLNKKPDGTNLSELGHAMGERLRHRGPDSSGVWIDEEAALVLSHRRLSIVDLTLTGHQPMVSPSGKWVIIYNGEVYNAAELRRSLQLAGFSFQGTSDTEVVLKACEHWGVKEATKKFVGMFAFALWEKNQRRLYLVRDRLGIKPLYWGFHRGILFFGSELKSFFAHPQWQPHIDRDALASYFRFGYVPTPFSIYENIHKLKPAHMVVIDEKSQVKEECFWDLSTIIEEGRQQPITDEKSALIELEKLLKEAVKCRLVSDVPVGAFLSGGVDSSLVVALMQAQNAQPVKTFTIGFEDENYNEAPYGRAVAKHLGTDHHELIVSSQEAQAVIPNLAVWYDEPFADSSQIPTYLVSQLARRLVAVSLSGDGGDEIFAGYTRYLVANRFWSLFSGVPCSMRKLLAKMLNTLTPDRWQQLVKYLPSRVRPSNITEKIDKFSLLLQSKPDDFYQPLMSLWQDPVILVKESREKVKWQELHHAVTRIERMQHIDIHTYLPDDILTKVDRASMAVSLEARVPLIDHRVVEYAWRLPLSMKIEGNQGKSILRQVLANYVPPALFERSKMGFGIPVGQWLRGPLRAWAEELLSENKLRSQGILNPDVVQQRWQLHLSGKRNFSYSLWSVLMFQAWYQQWKT